MDAVSPHEVAFRALYEANHGRVRALLTRMAGRQEAEDLTQATFTKAAQALPSFRGEADAATWIHRIAVNVALDWLRSRSGNEAKMTVPLPDRWDEDTAIGATLPDRPSSPEQALANKDMHDCIRGEIAKLPEAYRDVLMLSMLGELGEDEIAAALGTTPGNAKVRLHRARQEFKKIIAARCDFYRSELSCKPASPECCATQPPSSR
jgi:RNA polymerase sigma-70 factor (ECF subfamily)